MKIKFTIGRKMFLVTGVSRNFQGWYFKHGPFGCWNLYLGKLRIGWELARWH